jgi:hypothetical protein
MSPARSQSTVRGQGRSRRRTAILVLAISGAASLLLVGCDASDSDEGVAVFPPVEHMTSSQTAWLSEIDTLFDQRDAGFESVLRTQLGSATDLTHSGTPYVFEQIVPKA